MILSKIQERSETSEGVAGSNETQKKLEEEMQKKEAEAKEKEAEAKKKEAAEAKEKRSS